MTSDFVSFNTDLKVTGDSSYFNVGQRYSERVNRVSCRRRNREEQDNTPIVWYDNKDHVMREITIPLGMENSAGVCHSLISTGLMRNNSVYY